MWGQKYREKADKYSDMVRDRIFRDEFDDFAQFAAHIESLKKEF